MTDLDLYKKLTIDLKAEPHLSGVGYLALCPFHDDHNPSLYFSEKGFICLACGKTGALSELANRVGTSTAWELMREIIARNPEVESQEFLQVFEKTLRSLPGGEMPKQTPEKGQSAELENSKSRLEDRPLRLPNVKRHFLWVFLLLIAAILPSIFLLRKENQTHHS